jgi:hypothetical protein
MNAMSWIGRRQASVPQYTPSAIPPEAIEASQKAVKGYSFSRVCNAERLASVSARYGTLGMLFGAVWMVMWLMYPREHEVHHWMIWDGVHGMPYELPDFNAAVKDAPKAMHRYFSELYVKHREEFYYDTFASDRMHVSWQTGKEEMADYTAATDSKNADAPVVAMGKKGFVEIGITGSDVVYDKEHARYTSEVYFTRREQTYGQPRAPAVSMKAEFTWEKHPENVPDSAREYSPIGMVVVHYHRFREGVSQ